MMKLLSPPAEAAGTRRALLMLVGGGLLTAVLWLTSDPPPEEAPVVANRPGDRAATLQAEPSPLGFTARKVASVSTDLFGRHSWYVPPPPPPRTAGPSRPVAPTAPSLPFSLLGSYSTAGSKPVYFLVKGERVYDAHVGDVIENLYSVDGVSDGRLNFTYLPLKITQSLPVGSTP
jgi:hypothetical protein